MTCADSRRPQRARQSRTRHTDGTPQVRALPCSGCLFHGCSGRSHPKNTQVRALPIRNTAGQSAAPACTPPEHGRRTHRGHHPADALESAHPRQTGGAHDQQLGAPPHYQPPGQPSAPPSSSATTTPAPGHCPAAPSAAHQPTRSTTPASPTTTPQRRLGRCAHHTTTRAQAPKARRPARPPAPPAPAPATGTTPRPDMSRHPRSHTHTHGATPRPVPNARHGGG